MKIHGLSVVLGCVLGAVVSGFVVRQATKPDTTPRQERATDADRGLAQQLADLKSANRALHERAATQAQRQEQLEKELKRWRNKTLEPAPKKEHDEPTASGGKPTNKQVESAIEKFGGNLQHIIRGTERGKKAAAEVRAVLLAGGEEAIRHVIGKFEDTTRDPGTRLVIAHALAQSGDPIALESLKAHLRDPDSGLVLKRLSGHALAFSDAEGLNPVLEQAARTATDTGVRANAAFGLQRRGVEGGVDLYMQATDDAFAKGDPAALQYLGGLGLMGKKVLPAVRKRLGTYKEEQALVVLIMTVQNANDVEAIPALEKLAYDAARPKSVQNAAQGALQKLREAVPK